MSERTRKGRIAWVILVCAIAAALIGLAIWLARAIDIDRCLDSGGRWNAVLAACERA